MSQDTGTPIAQIPSDTTTLIIRGDFANVAPEALFEHWVKPELLQRWWPQQVQLDPQVGGAYHFIWPQQGWHLRGHYTAFEPGRRLAFTWKWDHDPAELPAREVAVTFDPLPGGTRLTLTHSPYDGSPADQEDRAGHLEGWTYFLPRLKAQS